MSTKGFTPFTTEAEVMSLATRALEALESVGDGLMAIFTLSKHQLGKRHQFVDSAVEALRFCATAAATIDVPALLPILVRAVEATEVGARYQQSLAGALATGIEHTLKKGGPIDKVASLLDHEDVHLRRAVAAGLPKGDPRARPLLEKLARDSHAYVRAAARDALGEMPWWSGKWSRDPLEGLSSEEAETHRKALEAISALLDRSRHRYTRYDKQLATLALTLPDALAVDLAKTVLDVRSFAETRLPALGAMLLTRKGGIPVFVSLCEAWGDLDHAVVDDVHVQMISRLTTSERREVSLALARRAIEWHLEGHEPKDVMGGGPAHFMATLAAQSFPNDDPTEMVELILGTHGRPSRYLIFATISLSWALDRVDLLPEALEERIIEAHLSGCEGAWGPLRGMLPKVIGKLPRERLRRVVERATESDREEVATWGLGLWLGKAYDPEKDPPRPKLAKQLWDDPRTRALLFGKHGDLTLVLPHARASLRRGELALKASVSVLLAIDRLWGGISHYAPGIGRLGDVRAASSRESARRRQRGSLGPRALRGAITAEEWRAFRDARAAHTSWNVRAYRTALRAMPEGPLHPEDRDFLHRAIDAASTLDRNLVDECAYALASCDLVESDLRLFDRLVEISPGDDRLVLLNARREAYKQVGVPPPGEGGAPTSEASRDWMDEPEEP